MVTRKKVSKKSSGKSSSFVRNVYYMVSDDTHATGGTQIAVVKYSRGSTMLEKRDFFLTDNGELRVGKARGFHKEDFDLIVKHAPKIRAAFKKEG